MCSKVIQPTARRVIENSPQPAVNNFAAAASKKIFSKPLRPGKVPPGRIAPRRSRSDVPKPARLQLRTPVGAAARPQTSERTEPCEGPYTRMTPGQPTMPRKEPMKTYSQLSHFGGLDWAKHHHDVCILEPQGQIVERLRFEHSGPGCSKRLKSPSSATSMAAWSNAIPRKLIKAFTTGSQRHPGTARSIS